MHLNVHVGGRMKPGEWMKLDLRFYYTHGLGVRNKNEADLVFEQQAEKKLKELHAEFNWKGMLYEVYGDKGDFTDAFNLVYKITASESDSKKEALVWLRRNESGGWRIHAITNFHLPNPSLVYRVPVPLRLFNESDTEYYGPTKDP